MMMTVKTPSCLRVFASFIVRLHVFLFMHVSTFSRAHEFARMETGVCMYEGFFWAQKNARVDASPRTVYCERTWVLLLLFEVSSFDKGGLHTCMMRRGNVRKENRLCV